MLKAGESLPETAESYDPKSTTFSAPLNENTDFFDWLGAPGQEYALYSFGMAMSGMNKDGPDDILRGSRSCCVLTESC